MITIIIPCRNERHYIGGLLASLLTQDYAGSWEAIIADGMSDDGTRAILQECCNLDPRIRVIDNPGRVVATGLNPAIREARGNVILRMDAHTEYASDYVRQCVEILETSGAQNVGGPARTKSSGMVQRAIAAAYNSPFSSGGSKFHDETYEGRVDTVPFGCWKKSTLEAVGLFDEAFVRNQDDELNFRIIRSGGTIWLSPRIVSWYQPRNSLAGLFRQNFQYGFWKVEVIRKHRMPASWRHVVPGAFVLGTVAAPVIATVAALIGLTAFAIAVASIWTTIEAFYIASCMIVSFRIARQHGWGLLPILPLVFAIYHFAYGAGFLVNALFYSFRRSSSRMQLNPLFTSASR